MQNRNFNYGITQEFLKSVVSYDEITGLFTWISSRGQASNGKPAGSFKRGYVVIKICNFAYQAHRLAWLYMSGEWPKEFIDHIDGNKSNNSISNLREATNEQNLQNRKRPNKDNTSGHIGIGFNSNRNKWTARLSIDKKQKQIGEYSNKDDAINAYLETKRKYHEFCTI